MARKPAWMDITDATKMLQHSRYVNQNDGDFTLDCGGHTYRVHREVVRARSRFLKALVGNGFLEAQEGQATLEDVDPLALDSLLYFMYTAEFMLDTLDFAWRFDDDWRGRAKGPSGVDKYLQSRAYPELPSSRLSKSSNSAPNTCPKVNVLSFETLLRMRELADRFLMPEEDFTFLTTQISARFRGALKSASLACKCQYEHAPKLLKAVYRSTTCDDAELRAAVIAECLTYKAKLETYKNFVDEDVPDADEVPEHDWDNDDSDYETLDKTEARAFHALSETLLEDPEMRRDWSTCIAAGAVMREELAASMKKWGPRRLAKDAEPSSWARHVLAPKFWEEHKR